MNISGWSIDGYGLLNNFEVRDLSEQLTVILGPNEAGKSTLLEFIRAMLFYPPRFQPQHPPLNGGQYGGRLFVSENDQAQWTIRRDFANKGALQLVGPDGAPGAQADLDRLLGNCDRAVFQSVFAFSLTELRPFDTSPKDEIGGKIFSSGIVGAGQSASGATKDLKARQDKLVRPSSSTNATLNNLAREIKEIRDRQDVARKLADTYEACCKHEADRRLDVELCRSYIDRTRAAKTRNERLIAMWPIWLRRCEAAERLSELSNFASLPADAEFQLDKHGQFVQTALDALTRAIEQQEERNDRRRSLTLVDSLARIGDEVSNMHRSLQVHHELANRLQTLEVQLKAAIDRLNERLRHLGDDWDRTRLSEFDNSISVQAAVRQWDVGLMDRAEAVKHAESALEQANKSFAVSKARLNELQIAFAELRVPVRHDEIDRLEGAVAGFRASRAESAATFQLITNRENRLSDLRRQQAQCVESSLPGWVRLAAIAMALMSAIAAVWQAVSGTTEVVAMLGIVFLIASAATVLVSRVHSSNRRTLNRINSEITVATAALNDEAHLHNQHTSLMTSALATLRLPEQSTSVDVETVATQLAAERTSRSNFDRALADIATTEKDVTLRTQEVDSTRASVRTCIDCRDRVHLDWSEWKRETGIPPVLSPKDVLEFCHSVSSSNESLRQVAGLEAEVGSLRVAVEDYATGARNLIEAAATDGLVFDQSLDPLLNLDRLQVACMEERERRKQAAELDEEIRRLELNVGLWRQSLIEAETNRDQMFSEAGVAGESEFTLAIEAEKSRLEYLRKVQEADISLASQLGQGAAADELKRELTSGQVTSWQDQIFEQEAAISQHEVDHEKAIAARRDAETARKMIEESADAATTELELESKEDALKHAIREWQVARLADQLIQATLAKYERERQPEVLAHASASFARVTSGRYTNLFQRQDRFMVEGKNGSKSAPEQLSRGTAEQLYLCLRLALAGDFHRRGQQLPLVMDDVLVNFDPVRALAVAQMLSDASREQQILLFTCHPETLEMLQQLHQSCGVIKMERFGVTSSHVENAVH